MPRKKQTPATITSTAAAAGSSTRTRAAERKPARASRERKPPTVFSPETEPAEPRRARRPSKRAPLELEDGEDEKQQPEYKRLEGRVRNHVKRLRYQLAFVEAYELEGWRRASREKLKPSRELADATAKIRSDKRAVADALAELLALQQRDTQYAQLAAHTAGEAALLADDIYCSRCGSTDADSENDILICDNPGCARAYHQRCQTPWVRAESIPAGDELWYCEVCLAVFNSLKLINSAFGTTVDTVPELFPELEAEERRAAAAAVDGGAEDSGGEDDDDEDFVLVEERGGRRSDGGEDSESDGASDSEQDTSGADAVGAGDEHDGSDDDVEVSDQELQYLKKADVIDLNRRSMRSREKPPQQQSPSSSASSPSLLGQRAAKIDSETGRVVFGVVVEEQEARWQVVYFNDTMEMLSRDQVHTAITRAKEHAEHLQVPAGEDAHDPQLIVHGKRKRTQVNYRALNDAMFAGKADSDEEAEDSEVGATDEEEAAVVRAAAAAAARATATTGSEDTDEDYVPKSRKKSSKLSSANEVPPAADPSDVKRSRRARKSVDYNALNEGLLGY